MNVQINISSKEEQFVAACWAYKRRHRTEEPTGAEFGIDHVIAEVLARQVHIEFERRQFALLRKARAA